MIKKRFLFVFFCLIQIFLTSCQLISNNPNSGSHPNPNPNPVPPSTSAKVQVLFSTSTSASNLFSLKIGSSYTVAVGFVTDTGTALSSLNVNTSGPNSLTTLPSGWTWTGSSSLNLVGSNFSNVAAGSGSQLFLTFAPTSTSQSGTLLLDYNYLRLDGTTGTGTVSLPYQATVDSNVYGSTSVPIQLIGSSDASSSGSPQTILVTFGSDNGSSANPPTNFQIIGGLSTLPAGWSSSSTTFSCTAVLNGCALSLNYNQSLSSNSGTVELTYSYLSDNGVPKIGKLIINYIKTAGNTLISIVNSGTGIVVGAAGSTQIVPITLTTSDGSPATNFTLTGTLPSGWTVPSGGSSLSSTASQVSGAGTNSAVVNLIYAPVAALFGVLSFPLTYTYTASNGVVKTGSVNVQYTATAAIANNVLYTTNVFGQISAPVGGTQTVSVSFFTDSGQLATGITPDPSDLATLATQGLSLASAFSCPSATQTPCVMTFNYSPPASNFSGAGILHFTYVDQQGVSKTGLVNIFVSSTVQNHVNATSSPSAPITVSTNPTTPQTVTVTFNTDQGTAILANASDTLPLPSGWSLVSSPTFPCTVTTSGSCARTYQYNPTANTSTSSFTISYNYTANNGNTVSGNFPISYSAAPPIQPAQPDLLPFRYFTPADGGNNQIKKCRIDAKGNTTITADCSIAADILPSLLSPQPISTNTYGSLHIASFTAAGTTKKFLYAVQRGFPQYMVRCTMYPTTDQNDPNYGNFDTATCNYSFLPPTPTIPKPGIGIVRAADGNTYLYYSTGNSQITKCRLDTNVSLPTTGNAFSCGTAGGPTIANAGNTISSFEFTYDSNNNATRIYMIQYNQNVMYTCALQNDGSITDSSPACTTALPFPVPSPPWVNVPALVPYAIKIKNGNAFISNTTSNTAVNPGRLFMCPIQGDGTFGPTPTLSCSSVIGYQGSTFNIAPTDIQVYSNTNYIYLNNDDNTRAPTICQIDTSSPGGVPSMGSAGACTSIDPNHSTAFTSTSIF